MTEEIVIIPGDGVDAEVTPTAVDMLKAIGNFGFVRAGTDDHVREETGEALPQKAYDLVAGAGAMLFDAAGETTASVILPLRAAVGSFVNVRPVKTYPGVDALRPETNLVFLRKSTEGVYSSHEDCLSEDLLVLTRVVTTSAFKQLVGCAYDYVGGESGSFQVAHKVDMIREMNSHFRDAAVAVADERGVETEEVLMDAFVTCVCLDPTQFDTIVCPNLAGDVLSDLATDLIGGLGLFPSTNIGPDATLFEPVHGSAPDIVGKGITNSAATTLSATMLLDYLDHETETDRVQSTVEDVLVDGSHTPSLGGNASTEDVTAAILDRLWAPAACRTGDSVFVSDAPVFVSDRFLIDEHPVFVPI